jgi:hypothetical protein
MLKPILVISLVAVSAAACNGSGSSSSGTVGSSSAAVTGHVAQGTGTDTTGFGGPSSVESSVTISAATIAADGTTASIANGPVASDGTFTLDVPVHAGPTLFQALDASGTVVVTAVLEDTLVEGKAATVQPLSTESSVEAAVLVAMAAAGTEVAQIDIPAIRARIDAATAMVVHSDAAQASQAKADVKALAVATLAAQMSQRASLTAAAVDWAQYVAAELQAADALTAALDANDAATAQARADFTAALAALDAKFGLSPAVAAQAVTNASASAKAAIAAEPISTALTDAFDHEQAMRDSEAMNAAVTEAFTTADAPAAVMTQLQAASTTLVTQVDAATDAAGVSAAFDAWRTTVRGTTAGTGGLVAMVVGPTLSATPAYVATITTLLSNDATLQTTLASSAVASESAAGVVDATKLAGLVSQAYATFASSIQTAVTSSTAGFVGADATLMSSVFVSSMGSF